MVRIETQMVVVGGEITGCADEEKDPEQAISMSLTLIPVGEVAVFGLEVAPV